jgi:hypothetical protein
MLEKFEGNCFEPLQPITPGPNATNKWWPQSVGIDDEEIVETSRIMPPGITSNAFCATNTAIGFSMVCQKNNCTCLDFISEKTGAGV